MQHTALVQSLLRFGLMFLKKSLKITKAKFFNIQKYSKNNNSLKHSLYDPVTWPFRNKSNMLIWWSIVIPQT